MLGLKGLELSCQGFKIKPVGSQGFKIKLVVLQLVGFKNSKTPQIQIQLIVLRLGFKKLPKLHDSNRESLHFFVEFMICVRSLRQTLLFSKV